MAQWRIEWNGIESNWGPDASSSSLSSSLLPVVEPYARAKSSHREPVNKHARDVWNTTKDSNGRDYR